MSGPIITFDRVCHDFSGRIPGLQDLTLDISRGEFLIICGCNGSGKTTLLRHMNALLTPTRGEVRVDGISTAKKPARARQLVGMVFADVQNQIVGETVADDVAFGPENLGLEEAEIDRRVQRSLVAVGMDHMADRRPHLLSGGEKQRVAVAGVLAMEPEVIVFDEPFSNLDYPGVRQVLSQMVALHESGKTLVVATHDIEKVTAHANRVVVMDQGKVALDGPVAQVSAHLEEYGVKKPCAAQWGKDTPSWLT